MSGFESGLEMVFQSKKNRFYLFYSHDQKGLEKAESLFSGIIQSDHADILLKDEVRYVLAKVYLAQHRVDEASVLLGEVARLEGARSNEAALLLGKL